MSNNDNKRRNTEIFVDMGKDLRTSMSDAEQNKLGCDSDTLELLVSLGDPSRKMPRSINGQYNETHMIVGYLFKSHKDIDVPVAPYDATRKGRYDVVDDGGLRHIKAGETFALNIYETAKLLSRPEYAGSMVSYDTYNDTNCYSWATMRILGGDADVPNYRLVREDGKLISQHHIGKPVCNDIGKVVDVELFPQFEDFKSYYDRRTYKPEVPVAKETEKTTKESVEPITLPRQNITSATRAADIACAFGAYFEAKRSGLVDEQ